MVLELWLLTLLSVNSWIMYSLAPTNNSANLPFEFWFSTLLYDQPYSDSRIICSYQWQMIRSGWHEHVSCRYASCTERAHDPWGGIGMVWYHIYYITSLRTVRDHDYWLAWWPTFCRWKAAFVTFTSSKELLGTMFTRSMMSTFCRWKAASSLMEVLLRVLRVWMWSIVWVTTDQLPITLA